VHRHGQKFTTPETMERAVGGGFDPEPLLRVVRSKLNSS
jgi:Zn-dependent M32 family carboxypeptidase